MNRLTCDRERPVNALASALLMLFATGWAANHFTALLPVLAHTYGLNRTTLDGAFGVYAIGLLPGLLGGGALSDRLGRRPLLVCGAIVAGLGNVTLLCWHDQTGVFVGRLVVGMGVGVAMSAGTAWSADLGGGSGSVLAGVALSAGFGCGPLASGILAQFSTHGTIVPFVVTIAISAAAVIVGVALAPSTVPHRPTLDTGVSNGCPDQKSTRTALSAALPMAAWVFACATVAMVTMTERMQYRFTGPWLPGVAAAITLTAGVGIQMIARSRMWGPRAGVAGASAAAIGFAIAAAAGSTPSPLVFLLTTVVLGIGYGLCLRQGLVDVETLSPPPRRGTLTGILYAVTYLGFGLPVLLVAIEPAVGMVTPLATLSAAAAGVAVLRLTQTRSHRTS